MLYSLHYYQYYLRSASSFTWISAFRKTIDIQPPQPWGWTDFEQVVNIYEAIKFPTTITIDEHDIQVRGLF